MFKTGFFSTFLCVSLEKIEKIVCYYGSWATYRPFPGTFNVENIDPTLCTHLVYAFAGINSSTGAVMSLDPLNDLEEGGGRGSYRKFTALSSQGVTTLLAVGGENEGPEKYSQTASTAAGRQSFASSATSFLLELGFGGLEVAWQFPGRAEGAVGDRANLVLLLLELSSQLHAAGLLLSVAVGAAYDMLDTSYDVRGISQYADMVNLMTFDYHTAASDNATGHNSPVFGRPIDPVPLFVNYTVTQWMQAGAPAEQLNVGIPLYGRSFTLQDASSSGVGGYVTGPGRPAHITAQPGYLAYYEICMQLGIEVVYDGFEVYAFKGDQWVSFENPNTIAEKIEYYNNKFGIGGIMVWPMETDDFMPLCGGIKNPLLTAINVGLGRL